VKNITKNKVFLQSSYQIAEHLRPTLSKLIFVCAELEPQHLWVD